MENLGWIDKTLTDAEGDKIGKIVDVHMDDYTGEPDWLAVNTGGRFVTKRRYVPLQVVRRQGDEITVPYTKGTVKDAPAVDNSGSLTSREVEELFSYYGLAKKG